MCIENQSSSCILLLPPVRAKEHEKGWLHYQAITRETSFTLQPASVDRTVNDARLNGK